MAEERIHFEDPRVDVVSKVLCDNWAFLEEGNLTQQIEKHLSWPEAPQYEGDMWVVDGESPRSLAEKVVAALDAMKET